MKKNYVLVAAAALTMTGSLFAQSEGVLPGALGEVNPTGKTITLSPVGKLPGVVSTSEATYAVDFAKEVLPGTGMPVDEKGNMAAKDGTLPGVKAMATETLTASGYTTTNGY